MTSSIRADEIKKEEELRLLKEREEKMARTIALCEDIGQILEELANDGKPPIYSFHCSKYDEKLSKTCSDYADRRLSYRTVRGTIDLDIMTEWFAKYCFVIEKTDFEYYQYGSGLCFGYTIKITPNPDCLT